MTPIRRLLLEGSPYALGYAHGKAYTNDIALLTEERMRLATDPFWTGGRGATMQEVRALGKASLAAHEAYAPALMEEMRGMAEATGLDVSELVTMNGFTDFVDSVASLPASRPPTPLGAMGEKEKEDDGGCTAFIVSAHSSADGHAYIGQTWDMHASATPHVILLDMQPVNAPALLTFTITGCVGMIGINEAGVAVGINNLNASDGRPGVHWPYVVRQMLAQFTVDAAMNELLRAPLSGAHNYVVMGPDATGAHKGFNVEASSTRAAVTPVETYTVHTNHCVAPDMQQVERGRKALSLLSTTNRLAQATRLLEAEQGAISLESLMALTKHSVPGEMSICAHVQPDYDVETSGAVIMLPETRGMWAAWGPPSENEYEHFTVRARVTV